MARKIFLILALILMTVSSAEAAEENNLPFEPVGTSYVQGGNEMLALVKVKSDGRLSFMVMAQGVEAIGLVPYSRNVYDFYINKPADGIYPPLISVMVLPGQKRGELDDNLGEWKGEAHLLPFYVLFDVQNGQVVCEDKLFSASGLNPSHYHDEIKNPNHIRLLKVFATHMPQLHKDIEAKGITLP